MDDEMKKMRKRLLEKLGMDFDDKSDIPVHEHYVEEGHIKEAKKRRKIDDKYR